MKTNFFNPLTLLLFTVLLFSSCNEDDLNEFEDTQNTNLIEQKQIAKEDENAKISCDYNLTNNGCVFTSGEGKPAASYNTMINMLDGCDMYKEQLPANCSWSNHYVTRVIEKKFLQYPCEPFGTMNFHLNNFKASAQAAKPNSSYLIVGYDLQSTFSWPGYFRLRIKVTYRKKGLCSLIAVPVKIK